jgi:hypothetical protein
VASLLGNQNLGLFHSEAGGKFGFYYVISRGAERGLPTNTVLSPFLQAQLPDGVGMTFDEEMVGSYYPEDAVEPVTEAMCNFDARMVIRDVNEFVDGYEHEAQITGTISFGDFEHHGPATFTIDAAASLFNYLRVNPATGEAEMRYHIEFVTADAHRYTLDGTKYMHKDSKDPEELLADYTTLFCRLHEGERELGKGLLKFRTFEDLAAIRNLAGFLTSFQITGTSDPLIQFQARMRFLAFTAQFVQREYDPLGWPGATQPPPADAGAKTQTAAP